MLPWRIKSSGCYKQPLHNSSSLSHLVLCVLVPACLQCSKFLGQLVCSKQARHLTARQQAVEQLHHTCNHKWCVFTPAVTELPSRTALVTPRAAVVMSCCTAAPSVANIKPCCRNWHLTHEQVQCVRLLGCYLLRPFCCTQAAFSLPGSSPRCLSSRNSRTGVPSMPAALSTSFSSTRNAAASKRLQHQHTGRCISSTRFLFLLLAAVTVLEGPSHCLQWCSAYSLPRTRLTSERCCSMVAGNAAPLCSI